MDAAGKIIKIKEAVRSNFEASPEHYESFEDRHGFFRELSQALISALNISAGADILDVGCGTGASSAQILDGVPRSRVWGLDNSSAMLAAARARFPESECLRFVEGDAGRLADYFDFRFEAVIYSASIFLIPDYKESLRQASELLKQSGSIGISFMDGVYDFDGNNLLSIADKEARVGASLKKPVALTEFKSYFGEILPRHTSWNQDFPVSETFLREFHTIPAMSAGLFPGLPYQERVRKVNVLFDHLPARQPLFRWTLMKGERV